MKYYWPELEHTLSTHCKLVCATLVAMPGSLVCLGRFFLVSHGNPAKSTSCMVGEVYIQT